jgi:hypothetical protein
MEGEFETFNINLEKSIFIIYFNLFICIYLILYFVKNNKIIQILNIFLNQKSGLLLLLVGDLNWNFRGSED